MSTHQTEGWGCNDVGNKDRFVKQFGSRMRSIIEDGRWVAWDGSRWKENQGKAYARAELIAKGIYREAAECTDSKGRIDLGRWAEKSQSRGQLENMLKLAAENLGVSVNDFDNDPVSINCKNGLVNLRTKELIPHSSTQLVMKRTIVNYDPEAVCPRWLEFLHEVFD